MELARALDELYAGTPDQFTSRRDAIVKEMKAAGDKDAAAQLARRRKPTQVAYVLNQLARKHPDEVATFVDVGRDLARAHRKALRGGGGAELTKAITAQRSAVKDLTALVGDVVNELASDDVEIGDATLAEVAGALQAALIDPAAAAALEEGQLEKAPEAPDASQFGFGDGADDADEADEAGADDVEAETREPEAQHARPKRRAPSSRDRPRRAKDNAKDSAKHAADERRARAQQDRERAQQERERAKQERERAKAAREREKEELADLAAAADRAEQIAKERAATAKELTDEAERLEKAARALMEQAQLAQQEAERAASEAAEARERVPGKARRRSAR